MRIHISPAELARFCEYVYQLTGIVLDDSKGYLFESRLLPLLKEQQMTDYAGLLEKARRDKAVEDAIINAMTTEESFFFRDQSPFDLLTHKLVPDLMTHKKKTGFGGKPDLRIWSAGSSFGQEAYSIAITLKELLYDLQNYRIDIQGTDIAPECVKRASEGSYTKFELSRGMTLTRLQRWFDQTDRCYRIKDELRRLCRFQRFNLHGSLLPMGRFDIIFCRNVAVYFSIEDRRKLFDKLADALNNPGFLIVGSTENLLGISQRYIRTVFQDKVYYQKI